MIIESLYNKLMNENCRKFKFSWEEELAILNSFGKPKTDIDRSYFQYKCQRKLMGEFKALLFDIVAFFMIIPGIILFLLMNFNLPKKTPKMELSRCRNF